MGQLYLIKMSKDLRHFLFFHLEYSLHKFRLIQFLREKNHQQAKLWLKIKITAY